MAYDAKAQEFAYSFYAKGWSKEKALKRIREVYAGFSGSTWDDWVVRYEWESRRAHADAKLREFDDLCRDAARMMLLELNTIRDGLYNKVKDGTADAQTVYAYVSVSKQIADLSKQHLATRDVDRVQLQVLQTAIDKLLGELSGMKEVGDVLRRNSRAVGEAVTSIANQFGA